MFQAGLKLPDLSSFSFKCPSLLAIWGRGEETIGPHLLNILSSLQWNFLPSTSPPSGIPLGTITPMASTISASTHFPSMQLGCFFAEHSPDIPSSSVTPVAFKKKKKKKKIPTFVDWHKNPSGMRPLLLFLASPYLISWHQSESPTHGAEQSPLLYLCTRRPLYLSCSYLYPVSAPLLPQDSVWTTPLSLGSLPLQLCFVSFFFSISMKTFITSHIKSI